MQSKTRIGRCLMGRSVVTILLMASPLLAVNPATPTYPDHTKLLVTRDPSGHETPITTPADWAVRRAHILAHFQSVAGSLPGGERRVRLDVAYGLVTVTPKFTRRKLTFATEAGDRVAAWLCIPNELKGKTPAVLCLHQTTRIGKDEPVGLGGKPNLAYAMELAERGTVTLSPDYPNFGESKVDPYALGYASATMKGVWNHMRAIDLLASLPEVDPDRIGVIGHSLGGHNAIFVAAFDDRIKAVVTSCGFNDFHHYKGGDIAGWSHAGYLPRLRSVYALNLDQVPFDFPELLAALAPRPVFINAPTRDDNFAVAGVDVCVDSARPVYTLLGARDRLVVAHPDVEHDFPPEVREAAYRFLDAAMR